MLKTYFFYFVDLFYGTFWLVVGVVVSAVAILIFGRNLLISFPQFTPFLQVLYISYPIWMPIILASLFFRFWMAYIRADFVNSAGSVLLEIKVPKETMKSPQVMEIFFTALYQTGSPTFSELYWQGKVRPWFSLEMASIDGQVRFYIWSFKKFKNLIETQLYAQYPNIEIHEAQEDYMAWAHCDPINLPMWATYFKFTKESVYPIKTYVDYGLDKDPKEEFKIDPMSSVIEYLGSLKKGEQAWIQIIIQAHRKLSFKNDAVFFKKPDWKHEVEHEIKEIREKATIERPGSDFPGMPNPTKGQQNTIAALERSVSKFPFETCIRGCYIAKKESFNPINITGLIGTFRQYSSNDDVNGFKLGWFTDFDYPWQDFRRMRRTHAELEMLEAIKLRSFFQPPFKNFEGSPLILNTEELATIYHFPGSAVGTPGLTRLPSKRVEPPTNLPI